MPPESDENLRLEIGHVLFIDIVGYSKLLIEEQRERLNGLTEIVLGTATVRDATDEQLVRLPNDPNELRALWRASYLQLRNGSKTADTTRLFHPAKAKVSPV